MSSVSKSSQSIEEKYQKLSQREHVLLRPGMYIGSVQKQTEEMWGIKNGTMVKGMYEYSPGFLKIFDEILTNATDASTRDPTVTMIKVEYNKLTGEISVWNNGHGIEVVEHKEHKMYIPELIFGHLLSGSNYNDSQKRIGAGTNGLGSKLTCLYSKKFIVETIDSENKKKFIQEYSDNMANKTKPKITSNSGKSYTKITFIPDYQRFNMIDLEDDAIALIEKRVYDCIVCTQPHVSIYLNGTKLTGKGLNDYIKYYPINMDDGIIYEKYEHNQFIWEYAIVPSQHYEHVSFVNGNSTYNGGKHVDYILYQIISKLKTLLESKKKLKELKPNFIKDKLFLFLRATVVNPSFNSQTKEQLTTQSKDFGVSVTVSDKFIDKIYKSSIVDEIVDFCKLKESSSLAKLTDGSKKNKLYGIPKLEDAILAGTAKSDECTLILTEGLSAMTFALWGRSVVGPERYGVFPLKGKCNSEDTKIPLWNGGFKLAKDINIGDELIGDDGNKRKVLTLFKGHGKMYEVSQDRGEPYKVNDEHILTLCIPEHKIVYWNNSSAAWRSLYWDKNEQTIKVKEVPIGIKVNCDEARKKIEEFLSHVDDNNIIDICIQDYLKIPDSMKRKLKGIRGQCVNWEEKDVALDPYVLGLWLGDGMKEGRGYVCYGDKDPEIIDYLNKWCEKNDAFLEKKDFKKYLYTFHSSSPLRNLLKTYNLLDNKHIPKDYLINSREVRLQLLAGIIDTDGYVTTDGTIEISQSHIHEQLAEDIIYLSRSLGFYTYVVKRDSKYTLNNEIKYSESYRIKISGDIDDIPTLLPRKKTKSTSKYNMRNSTGIISVKEIENGKYVGIGIDANNRFLINDFTITHNCINVRDATTSQLLNNEELNSIKQIIGLKQNVDYKDTKSLRYGKVMILTDADVDGSHIKALFVNMIHAFYPGLIKLNFITTMKTPIVKATKGKQTIEFFTEQDYKIWKDSNINTKNYNIKYFKGLGTSKKEDAQDLFKRLDTLGVKYYYKDSKCDDSILLAFEKDKNTKDQDISCTDMRKKWLNNYDKMSYIDLKETKTSYQDLINKELIHFSIYDNLRSIPSLCDGLKPSQRKILYYMLKNNINKDIKVAQLSGYISAEMSYHHGEVSLQGAIINMAQDFVGSNNINLLVPEGNYGSRLTGKDAASPRYIFTRLENITTKLFNPLDNNIYNYLNDDGVVIEPEFMLPIIPMVLVNGCEGIATGYSTFVPSFHPKDITNILIDILEHGINDNHILKPYFKGFNGDVVENTDKSGTFTTVGKWKRLSNTKIEINEIPVGTWVTTYKEFLETFIENSKNPVKKKFYLKDVQNLTKDENSQICFIIEFKNQSDLDSLIENNSLEKELKLTKSFSTNNMHLFNPSLILTKYNTPLDILKEYYNIRLEYYEKRRQYMISKLKEELLVLESKIKFTEEYIDGTLDINKKSKDYSIQLLTDRHYHKVNDSYDYLLNTPVSSFTLEKITELSNTHKKKQNEYEYYLNINDKNLWLHDLKDLLTIL
jgi:DNA gyrase/topoisomerase IV subunit B